MNVHYPMWDTVINGNVTSNNLVNVLFKFPYLTLITLKALPTYISTSKNLGPPLLTSALLRMGYP